MNAPTKRAAALAGPLSSSCPWRPHPVLALTLFCLTGTTGAADAANPEAFEVGATAIRELPEGKEADGIIGDFVLRNDRITALVSGNLPGRKANMGTNWSAPTPGCLYDLCVRGSRNDQLTNFAPGGLEGPVSSVRLLGGGSDGTAVVLAERTAARGGGLAQRHEYHLGTDWGYLVVVSTYVNHGTTPVRVRPAPSVKGLVHRTTYGGIVAHDAMNPRDHQGYAHAPVEWPGARTSLSETSLAPGESLKVAVAVAPGASPAEAYGVIAARRQATGRLRARVLERDGEGISSAIANILLGRTRTADGATVEHWLPAYPDAGGGISVRLPAGSYALAVRDRGRPDVSAEVTVTSEETTSLDLAMERAARVNVMVLSEGRRTPCKVQFLGLDGTPDPVLGVDIQAHGCNHQYHSENGAFTLQIDPGKYRVIITRGMEYDHHESTIVVKPGAEVPVRATLQRVVDTPGWISTDYHNHSTPSGDNYCGTDDRLINLAAEQIEFAPATEHNRIYDWKPHIDRLRLTRELRTVTGIELTGPNAHFNSFPLEPTPYVQDNGAPIWVEDPRINAIVLRDFGGGRPDRWVQLNHPDVGKFFRDRNADGQPDGGYADLEKLIDAAEVWSTEILMLQPARETADANGKTTRRKNRTFEWLQLLNQGRHTWCVAVSDAHSVFGNGVGGWRTYVMSSTDDVTRIDPREIIRNSKAGRMMLTNGPYLEVQTEDGTAIGGHARDEGLYHLRVRVQTTTWIDIDRVQVLVNGRARKDLDFRAATHPDLFVPGETVSFEATIPVPLTRDAHLIVAAVGENFNLATGFGKSWQSGMHPCAFTNPIFVDVDGNGYRPNGDTLDYPLPVGRVYSGALGER